MEEEKENAGKTAGIEMFSIIASFIGSMVMCSLAAIPLCYFTDLLAEAGWFLRPYSWLETAVILFAFDYAALWFESIINSIGESWKR